MDAAAKPPRMGLRRLPQPDPPRHPAGSQLWLLLRQLQLPPQVQGAALPHTPHTTGMLCCPRLRYGGVAITISASE